MRNKNIIVTGGNAGIGFATSAALAKQGANIYMIARNKHKAEKAAEEITTATGNKHVKFFLADLSSQKSIRKVAEEIKNEIGVIDVLINNAGAVFSDFELSIENLEMTIATNHFAYFLLTNLFLDQIKKSPHGRIVNVASGSHYRGRIDFASFTEPRSYFVLKAYAQSKLANVLFTNELAERLSGTHVTVNSLHPGGVNTGIGNKNTKWYASLIWTLSVKLATVSIEKGAETSVYLASSPDVKNTTGKYFDNCKEKKPSNLALDKELGKELWRVTESYIR